ncbi:MAG: PP2C family protein-serine/threonine phosphatase [Marmoricola sp.]
MALTVTAAGRTHIGLVRRRNQDSWHVGQHLFAVADGLGGHVDSDIASRTVIDMLRLYDQPSGPANLADVVGRAIHTANVALSREIATNTNLAGMASTLVALFCSGSVAVLANVGDSRAYLLRDGKSVLITEDHNYKRTSSPLLLPCPTCRRVCPGTSTVAVTVDRPISPAGPCDPATGSCCALTVSAPTCRNLTSMTYSPRAAH